MRRIILLVLFALCSSTIFGQSFEDFRQDFRRAIQSDFTKENLNRMFTNYGTLLTPHSDVTQLVEQIKGTQVTEFPLAKLKNDTLYSNNIHSLFTSTNSNRRILAYLVIAASGDTSFENQLLVKIKEEKEKGCLIWAGMALLYLKTNHTTELFDFLIKNEDFGDPHMFPLFIKLNKDLLRQTAYSKIHSENIKAKVIAAQLLAYTGLNKKTEDILKQAVKEWSYDIKGYAIFAIKELQIGDLWESFKPLLDSTKTRAIALEALANSSTEADRKHVYDLIMQANTVSEELLDCLYQSKNIENIKLWLTLLYSKPLPSSYKFFVFQQPLLSSDSLLPFVQETIVKLHNDDHLGELVRALANHEDEKSIDILVNLLSHPSETVRYWTATALKGKQSDKLKAKVPEILKSPKLRVTSLTELAIENGIDTLQAVYKAILKKKPGRDWYRSALEYLSAFPRMDNKELFISILKKTDEDSFVKRSAAMGLARMKDTSSVDLIISVCHSECRASDYNALVYLAALGTLKGEKARCEIEKFTNSKEISVREVAAEILKKW